jgi:3-hydroxybutyryl-CoA dehydrogenase
VYALYGGRLADELSQQLRAHGHVVSRPVSESPPHDTVAAFVAEADRRRIPGIIEGIDNTLPGIPVLAWCLTASRTEIASWSRATDRVHGFVTLPPLRDRGAVEWIGEGNPPHGLWALGLPVLKVGDAPGGMFPRILATLVNEAAFAHGAGVATAAEIDTAMRLGTNYPRGPFQWAEETGLELVAAILGALHDYYGEERYRTAPLLRRAALAGRWPL